MSTLYNLGSIGGWWYPGEVTKVGTFNRHVHHSNFPLRASATRKGENPRGVKLSIPHKVFHLIAAQVTCPTVAQRDKTAGLVPWSAKKDAILFFTALPTDLSCQTRRSDCRQDGHRAKVLKFTEDDSTLEYIHHDGG
jgi:hypothetical protein